MEVKSQVPTAIRQLPPIAPNYFTFDTLPFLATLNLSSLSETSEWLLYDH
jgi:hypothetical protein